MLTAQGDIAGLQPVYFNLDSLDRGFNVQPDGLVQNPQVDVITLAAGIMWPGSNPLSGNYTYYEGLRKLQPGDMAAISEGKLDIRSTYPAEDDNLTFEKTAVTVGHALKQCITRCATQRPGFTSSDFSGGFDSTTLALAAAAQCTPGDTILGLVQYSNEYPAGDIPYARTFARLRENLLLHELVTTADDLPFVSLPPPHLSPHEPYRGTAIFGRERKRLMAARRHHLTGDAGDALFDPEPIAPLADLLLKGEYGLARDIALHIGRAALVNPEAILDNARIKARTNLSASYERVAKQLTSDRLLDPSRDWLPSLGIASTWLTPKIREALAARAQKLAEKASDIRFSAYATQQAIRDSGDAHRHLQMLAEQCGVRLVAPYLDETVLHSIIALPTALRIRPGQFKPLLQAASSAAALAPADIFMRQSKGAYSGESKAGFAAALPRIRHQLQNLRLAHLGIIEPEAVLASLAHTSPPLASLTQLLASEAWLAHLGIDAPQKTASGLRPVPVMQRIEKVAELPSGAYAIPPSLQIAAGQHDKLIAFDRIRGNFQVLPLNHTARLILQTLTETHSPQLALEALRIEYPEVPVKQLTADLASAIRSFVNQGWLQPADNTEMRIERLSSLKLPFDMTQRVITYIQSLKEAAPTDAHHFASVITGSPASLETANDRAADIVRNGIEIPIAELEIGAHGVIGVLESAHGLTHGLHSVIGLGDTSCLSVIGRQGNVGIAPVKNFLTYYKQWLASMNGFASDADKVRLYV